MSSFSQAAHCIEQNFSEFFISLGKVERNVNATWETRIVDQSAFHRHPSYNETTRDNDIGLVYLAESTIDILDGFKIKVINLPTFDDENVNLVGKKSIVSGFGSTGGLTRSNLLKKVELFVVENENCIESFPTYVSERNLCGGTEEGIGPCPGDEGEFTEFE